MANIPDAEPGVFATEATQNALGPHTMDSFQALSPDGQHVIIVGVDDIQDMQATPDLIHHFNEVMNPDFAQSVGMMFYKDVGTGTATTDTNLLNAVGQSMDYAIEHNLLDDMEQLRYEKAIQRGFLSELGKQFADNACFITIPQNGATSPSLFGEGLNYENMTVQGNLEGLLGAKPGRFDDLVLPGTPQDLQLWVGHHEMRHCTDGNEYEADAHANRKYAEDLTAGRATDAEFPYFKRTMRAAGAVMGVQTDDYILNGLSPLAGERPLTLDEMKTAVGEVAEARNRIYDIIQQDTNILYSTLLDPDNSTMQARMVYEQAKTMLDYNAFDDIPYGKTSVERFVEGAQRYLPDFYAVPYADRITEPPQMPPEAYGIVPAQSPSLQSRVLEDLKF